MTDREYDFWKSVFLLAVQSDPIAAAAGIADECLDLLRKRTASVPQPASDLFREARERGDLHRKKGSDE